MAYLSAMASSSSERMILLLVAINFHFGFVYQIAETIDFDVMNVVVGREVCKSGTDCIDEAGRISVSEHPRLAGELVPGAFRVVGLYRRCLWGTWRRSPCPRNLNSVVSSHACMITN